MYNIVDVNAFHRTACGIRWTIKYEIILFVSTDCYDGDDDL